MAWRNESVSISVASAIKAANNSIWQSGGMAKAKYQRQRRRNACGYHGGSQHGANGGASLRALASAIAAHSLAAYMAWHQRRHRQRRRRNESIGIKTSASK
jgi:hypothetical protein